MTFNAANTVEQMILDACQRLGSQFVPTGEPTALAAGVSGQVFTTGEGAKHHTPDSQERGQ